MMHLQLSGRWSRSFESRLFRKIGVVSHAKLVAIIVLSVCVCVVNKGPTFVFYEVDPQNMFSVV